MHKLVTFFGWVGVIAILLAFSLNLFGYISAQSLGYLLLNIVGSLFIVVEALKKKDYPSGVLNIVWALFGVVALIRAFL